MGDEHPMSASTGAIKKKKDEKARRRDQRSWDNIIRSTSGMSDGERMATIEERYNEVYAELRKAVSTLVGLEKQFAALQKDRDHLQTELTKNILAKAKLESLCRELQKQNKLIKEENLARIKEEEEKRREVATNFTEKLNSLTTLMDENKDKSVRLREENISMTTKLTELYNQFQEREGHLTNMNRQMDLQKQLSETQLQKLQAEMESERQVWEQERKILTTNLERSEQTNLVLETNLKSLQEHLEVYKGQYSDFESTMEKSSKVFDAFKAEMSVLQKKNATLERERNEYMARWQGCNDSVVQMSDMQQQVIAELKAYEKKIPMLENVCRTLQAERTAYQKQLVENNLVPVYVPQPENPHDVPGPSTSGFSLPPPVISHAAQKKLTKKEKMLVALKSELKSMEDKIKVASKQQDVAKENQEAGNNVKETESDTSVPEEITVLPRESRAVASSSSQPEQTAEKIAHVPLKAAKSLPIADDKQKRPPDELFESASSSSSADNILTELSLDDIPLYKPKGSTDIQQMANVCFVKESEGHTDLLGSTAEGDQASSVGTDEVEEVQAKSAVTIPLKETVGKTEINK